MGAPTENAVLLLSSSGSSSENSQQDVEFLLHELGTFVAKFPSPTASGGEKQPLKYILLTINRSFKRSRPINLSTFDVDVSSGLGILL